MLSFILAFWKAVKAFDREVGAWGEGFSLLDYPMEVTTVLVQRIVARFTEKDLNGAMVAPAIVAVPDKDRNFMTRWSEHSGRVSVEGNDTYVTVRLRGTNGIELTADHCKDGFKFILSRNGMGRDGSVDDCITGLNLLRGHGFDDQELVDLALVLASLGAEFKTSDKSAECLDYWADKVGQSIANLS